ncbi:M48 family metallopeptidase [Aliivibrio kagoshimensis]|uniref:M48 family metallopeptidase n=1 Tax=Aliivibrio kagoshimensis TaxID=2910230 RepID=UPI003D0A3F4F
MDLISKKCVAVSLLGALLIGCTSSPTGRNQVILFSSDEMSQLGVQSFEQLKKQEKISTDKALNHYVQCVAKTITDHVPKQPDFSSWEVVLFDSDQVNAFALPGGKIGVYTGLLNVAKNQDQLATVIGHEVAHVLANHGNERMSHGQLADIGLKISSIAIEGSEYHDTAMGALGLGVQYGVMLPYGRSQESEADILGLELMAKSGFDPYQSVELWKNMAKQSKSQPPELLSTHPSNRTRIDDLSAGIVKLNTYQGQTPTCSK